MIIEHRIFELMVIVFNHNYYFTALSYFNKVDVIPTNFF
jgi:hypothetical protein